MTYFENERMRTGGSGRAPNLGMISNRGVTRQEVGPPHGRAHALSTLVPRPGGLIKEREGRGLSLPTPTTPPATPPGPLGRGFPLPSTPTSPPPLEYCSPPMRHHEAPLRQPHTMPCCLQPHGRFPTHHLCYVLPKGPHDMMTCFPPVIILCVYRLQLPLPNTFHDNPFPYTLLLPIPYIAQ